MTYIFSRQFLKKSVLLALLPSFVISVTVFGQLQYISKYPDIPIVDVHVHIRGVNDVSNYLKVSEAIKQNYGSNLSFFIGLSVLNDPVFEEVMAAGKNRFLFAVSEMTPHKGINKTPEEIVSMIRDGYVGLKFWFGDPHRVIKEGEEGITRIDDPYFEKLFSTLEQNNVLMTSLHIADPNGPFGDRQPWMADPVYYWTQIRAFEDIVAKYPKLTIVAAHCAWIICQDAQLDYLRYMFSTYPNLYVDVSATFRYMYLLNPDNLRDLFIEYQDRFLYGSDTNIPDDAIQRIADRFAVNFAILESHQIIERAFESNKPIQGLNLPKEVLEKIYYKNALKLYPGLKEATGLLK